MSFKVAVATSDGVNVDTHFGQARSFAVYTVDEDGAFERSGTVEIPAHAEAASQGAATAPGGCGSGGGCGGGQGGCGAGAGGAAPATLAACFEGVSYVLAAHAGNRMCKALGARGVTLLAVELPLADALAKVAVYEARLNRFRNKRS